MRVTAAALVVLATVGGTGRFVSSHGVRLVVPAGWQRVRAASDAPISDPRTLLVVGTPGVRPKASRCEIAAYRIPLRGAVVVIVGWKTLASAGGHNAPGRAPLRALRTVTRASFECFAGRGAAAQVTLGGRAYQVNVMVGDRATKRRIAEALAVARSFEPAR